MAYGVTLSGFVKKTLTVLRAELEAAWRATFGASVVVDPRSPNGQLIGIHAERLAELWDLAQAVEAGFDPDRAQGLQLDMLAALTGTVRMAATKSTATLLATGTAATVLPDGRVVSVAGLSVLFETTEEATLAAAPARAASTAYGVGAVVASSGNLYLCTVAGVTGAGAGPSGTGTAEADGTVTWRYLSEGDGFARVPAQAQEDGPVIAAAYTLTGIETPIFGWSAVVNEADAVTGRAEETDAELRIRREDELRSGGAGTLDAIRVAVLDVPGVTAATVFQNITGSVDADGMPPHSVEVLVQGGEDQDVLDALLASVAAGIATHGTEEGTAEDSEGNTHTVKFSRPEVLTVYVVLDVVKDPATWPADGEAQIAQAIVTWGEAQRAGRDVVASALSAQAFTVSGVLDVTDVRIGTAPAPADGTTIPVSLRQLADYDTARISVNVVDGEP